MTATWTASPRCISMSHNGQFELIACAPSGMAGTKEWAERAKLMAAAPDMYAALQEVFADLFRLTAQGEITLNTARRIKNALEKAGQP